MNIEDVRAYCLSIPGASECLPFDDVTLVFKVMNKMFALIPLDATVPSVAVKCDPELVPDLREHYEAVTGAGHFNKKYWNAIQLESDMPGEEILRWIQHSVDEVVRKLPRKQQEEYRRLP